MQGGRLILISLLAVSATSCSEPLEFADWTLPVPDDARVIEYPYVPDEQRSGWIELQPDLVLGDDDNDPNEGFYGYPTAKVAADGRIFVLDNDNHRVQVFSSEGEYLQTLGGEGQGPTELYRPTSLAVTDDAVVVSEAGNGRFNAWSLDGLHRDIFPAQAVGGSLGFPTSFYAMSDGTFVGRHATYEAGDVRGELVGRFSLTDEAMLRYAERRRTGALESRRRSLRVAVPSPSLAYAIGPDDAVYVTDREHYQALKFAVEGELQWALRTNREPPAFPDPEIERRLETLRGRFPDVSRSEFAWPESLPTLRGITVDGAARLYVFPYLSPDRETPPSERRPVDVYTPDGERIFTGWLRGAGDNLWTDAHAGSVYATAWDQDAQEWHVVRYRLITPFDAVAGTGGA